MVKAKYLQRKIELIILIFGKEAKVKEVIEILHTIK